MTSIKNIAAVLVAATVLVGAATASADEGFVELHPSATYNGELERAISGEPTVRGSSIIAGWGPDRFDGIRVMLEYGGDGFTAGSFDGDLDSKWGRDRVMAGVGWSRDLVGDWLGSLVRGAVGYSYQTLELTSDTETYRGTDHGLAARIGAGLEVSLFESDEIETTSDRISVGINTLVGYGWQSTASFDEMENADETDGDDDWQRTTYDVGSMQMSGPQVSGGVNLRYRFGD